jgi:hypothetical protein
MMQPLWVALSCVVILGSARLIQYLPFPLPRCGFRTLTGIPCPLCGGTHALIAWSELHPAAAFHFNPIVAFAPLAAGLWLATALLDWCFGLKWARRIFSRLREKPCLSVLLCLALLNWIYLILWLPR